MAFFEIKIGVSKPFPFISLLILSCVETLGVQCLAKVILIMFVGLTRKCWRLSLAMEEVISLSNSTKAMSDFPGTKRTSLKPGNLGFGKEIRQFFQRKEEKKELTAGTEQ